MFRRIPAYPSTCSRTVVAQAHASGAPGAVMGADPGSTVLSLLHRLAWRYSMGTNSMPCCLTKGPASLNPKARYTGTALRLAFTVT